jgi:multiple sugar transport system ATP-binding protein
VPLPSGVRPPDAGRVVLGVRPESFEDAAYAAGLPTVEVDVEVVEDLGSDAHVFFHVDAAPITAEILEAAADSSLLQADRALFAARVDPRSAAQPAGRLELAVDPARFHFFDPDSGERLSPRSAAELQPAG